MVVSDTKIIKFKELKDFIKKSINKVISNYLSLNGGTMKGDIVFNNGLGIKIKDDVGTQNDVLNTNNINELNIGNTLLNMKLISDETPIVEVGGVNLGAIAYAKQLNEKLSLSGGTMSNNSRIKFPDSNNGSNFYVGYDGISMECNNNAPDFYIKNMGNGQVRNMLRSIRNSTSDYEVTNIIGDANAPTQIESYSRPVVIEYGSLTQHQIAYLSDTPQIKEVTAQFTPTVAEASGANEAEVEIDVSNWGVSNWRKVRIMYIHCAILNSDGGTNYSQNGYRNVNSFMINNGAITIKTYGCVPNQPNTIIVGYIELP
jgi:hypothetical protein